MINSCIFFSVKPHCYHSVVNSGFKVAEAVNFATLDWFQKKRKVTSCLCGDTHVKLSASTKLHIHNYVYAKRNKSVFFSTSEDNEMQAATAQNKASVTKKKVKCQICAIILNQGCLKRHIQNKHETHIFKCHKNKCNKEFGRSSNLTRHINTVHQKRDGKLRCPACSKLYSDKWELNRHKRYICKIQN